MTILIHNLLHSNHHFLHACKYPQFRSRNKNIRLIYLCTGLQGTTGISNRRALHSIVSDTPTVMEKLKHGDRRRTSGDLRTWRKRFKPLEQKKKNSGLQSASELYRPSDRRLSEKLVPTWRIKGVAWSGQRIPTAVNFVFLDRSRYCLFK
jgi:hypothetical protein